MFAWRVWVTTGHLKSGSTSVNEVKVLFACNVPAAKALEKPNFVTRSLSSLRTSVRGRLGRGWKK